MAESKTHEIVILGGHFAALGTAHYLLKHIIPKLSTLAPSVKYHITIVAPHTEFFWNPAAPRYIIGKDVLPASKIFLPIAAGFKDYKAEQYTILQGKAIAVDAEKKVVSVRVLDGTTKELGYTSLVVATGTTGTSQLWQINDHEDITKDLFHSLHAALPKAKTILIAGGGAVGVETAGEVATHYPTAELTLLSGADRLLPRLFPKTSAAGETKLKNLGVTTVHNLRVTSTSKNDDGTTTLVLSDNTTKVIDIYIDATGGKPNTSFLPAAWLDSDGYVITDNKTTRTNVPGVYAIGDVASYTNNSLFDINLSIAPVATNLGIDIAASAGKQDLFAPKPFKPMRDSMIVPTGPSTGVGQLMGWKVPGWVVWLLKSRTFMVDMAEPFLTGKAFAKA
jgi:NADH dehydrogenase FAD-containing subunit